MSLLVISTARPPASDPRWAQACAEAGRQGFEAPVRLAWQGGEAHWYPTPGNPRGSGACVQRPDGRFAAYVGTVHLGRLTGPALLEALLSRDTDPAGLPLDDLCGSFVMLMGHTQVGAWLFGDVLGIHKHYQTPDGQLRSTSFMVLRATLGDAPRLVAQRAQEYVLLGANHAPQTPFEGVLTADPTLAVALGAGGDQVIAPAERWRGACPHRRFDEAVEDIAARIASRFADMAAAFGPDIGMALSGGMDSRLLLAALDRVGVTPTLYVYGRPDDADVRVARTVAAALGLPIDAIDKAALDVQRHPQPALGERWRANLAFFDGLAPDGAMDPGSDRETRLLQVQGGRLNLNGGGGEILRNFFYLRDRPFTPRQLAQAFYSNWPAEVFAERDAAEAMRLQTAEGIARNLGLRDDAALDRPLSRGDVELVYSLFRLRWWMGRNNSLAGRYGAFLTPFVQPHLVRLAASLPLAWKDYGRLECAVIRRLSPRVAAGPSAYGFSFADGPDLRHRLRVLATALRPAWLRAQSANIRRALGRRSAFAPPAEWLGFQRQMPDCDWLSAAALTDTDSWNRLLTVQAVAQWRPGEAAVPPKPNPIAAPC